MIRTHRTQLDLSDEFIAGFIAERPQELWEPWMRQVDQALDDERLLEIIQDAWNRLCKKSKTRGRPGTPAEVILRLLLLKHIRDWSYEELAREVRANFVYRQFTRIGGGQVPDDKSMSRFSRQLGPAVIEKLHQRVVALAQEKKVIQGRKLRVDTTVVETNIHYPTDSTLLGDSVHAPSGRRRTTEMPLSQWSAAGANDPAQTKIKTARRFRIAYLTTRRPDIETIAIETANFSVY